VKSLLSSTFWSVKQRKKWRSGEGKAGAQPRRRLQLEKAGVRAIIKR